MNRDRPFWSRWFSWPGETWRQLPVRWQGRVLLLLPLLAVVISALIAVRGSYQRAKIEIAIQRHFQWTHDLTTLLNTLVDAETGMRGYLLMEMPEYLAPYQNAEKTLPELVGRLEDLANSEPDDSVAVVKLRTVTQLRDLARQQMDDLAWQKAHVRDPKLTKEELAAHLAQGKAWMDLLRVNLDAMRREELMLFKERVSEIETIRIRDYLGIAVALLLGVGTRLIAWILFNRNILDRIHQIRENLRRYERSEPWAYEASGKNDALGEVEVLVHALPPRQGIPLITNHPVSRQTEEALSGKS